MESHGFGVVRQLQSRHSWLKCGGCRDEAYSSMVIGRSERFCASTSTILSFSMGNHRETLDGVYGTASIISAKFLYGEYKIERISKS